MQRHPGPRTQAEPRRGQAARDRPQAARRISASGRGRAAGRGQQPQGSKHRQLTCQGASPTAECGRQGGRGSARAAGMIAAPVAQGQPAGAARLPHLASPSQPQQTSQPPADLPTAAAAAHLGDAGGGVVVVGPPLVIVQLLPLSAASSTPRSMAARSSAVAASRGGAIAARRAAVAAGRCCIGVGSRCAVAAGGAAVGRCGGKVRQVVSSGLLGYSLQMLSRQLSVQQRPTANNRSLLSPAAAP